MLSSDGSVSASFHWDDPADTRDVHEVLMAEGIAFDEGYASASRRITSEELANLVDVGDEDDLMFGTAPV